jgi:hypothetical protein
VHQITYDLTGAWDASNPITPIPNVFFEYMSSGDIRRLAAVDLLQASNQSGCRRVYAYDGEARLASDSWACLAGQPLAVDYGYDSLSRIVSRTYPLNPLLTALASGFIAVDCAQQRHSSCSGLFSVSVRRVDFATLSGTPDNVSPVLKSRGDHQQDRMNSLDTVEAVMAFEQAFGVETSAVHRR